MKNLELNTVPATIEFNYESMKADIEKTLKKYATVVTEDTVADAKKSATELNALKNDIDAKRKEAIRKVSAPIKEADDQMKELVKMLAEGRQQILDQVSAFDAKELENLDVKLLGIFREEREKLGTRSEFRTQGYGDLVILSNRTKAGGVTKKAADEIRHRASEEHRLQSRTDTRLLELENHSYRAGLEAPLTRQYVEHFLFEDDEEYGKGLERIIQAELDRQQHAAERRERMEKQAEPKAQPEPETKQEPQPEEPKKPNRVLPSGKVGCTVTATFKIQIHPETPTEMVEKKLKENMEKAGITTLASVDVSFD